MAAVIPFLTRRTRDPFNVIKRDLTRLFEDIWPDRDLTALFSTHNNFLFPDIDVMETNNEISIQAELPGMEEKDISVELSNNLLTIKGEKKIERKSDDKNYHVVERQSGAFTRSIQLPFEVNQDQIDAKFKNGVLTITLPKSEQSQRNVKKIPVHKE